MTSRLIQYASDIHLECMPGPACLHQLFTSIVKPVAPTLVLAGDVGNPAKPLYGAFLRYCSERWKNVVVIAGNHEFYNCRPVKEWKYSSSGPDTAEDRERMCLNEAQMAGANVHYLQRRRVILDGVAFLGATLWVADSAAAAHCMNDFHRIATLDVLGEKRPLRPEHMTDWHRRDREWLKDEIQECEKLDVPTVVVTHHLPTVELIHEKYLGPKYASMTPAFATDCSELFRKPVVAWIAGHTHTAMCTTIARRASTQVVSNCCDEHFDAIGNVLHCGVNPRGYPGTREIGESAYSPARFLELA